MRATLHAGTSLVVSGLFAATLGGTTALAKKPSETETAKAKKPPVTKMKFKLDDHNVELGEALTGSVLVRTRINKSWEPLAGASLSLRVATAEVGMLTTDAEGYGLVDYAPAEEGGGVMRVVYEGDESHKRAKRAQGFQVGAAAEEEPVAAA